MTGPRLDSPVTEVGGVRVVVVGHGVLVGVGGVDALAGVAPVVTDAEAAGALPDWRAREYLAARALLRRLLAELAGAEAAALPISVRPGGQPYLPDRPELAISLSHDAGRVAAAAGGGAVGVDVQVPAPASPALLRRCCSERVRAELAALPDEERDREFAWIWTAQEACVKATGEGLAGRPWTVPVAAGRREGEWRGHRWLSLREESDVPVSVAFRPTTEPTEPGGGGV